MGGFLLGLLLDGTFILLLEEKWHEYPKAGIETPVGQVLCQEQTCYDTWELTGSFEHHTETPTFSGQACMFQGGP